MTSITFRTSGAWGAGAGANLTPAQVDTNFYNLKLAVEAIQASPPEAVSVDSVVQSANTLTFYMTDGTTQGPFTLPAAQILFRGDWTATTAYAVGDIVAANSGLYIVLTAHTSAATFDPGANDGSGHDYYDQILAPALPTGGTTGQVLAKASGTDFDVEWVDRTLNGLTDVVVTTPATGEVLTYNGTSWINAVPVGDGSGGGGAGGATFEGASLTVGTTTTIAHNDTVPFSDVNYASASGWYSTTGGILRLRVLEESIVEIGFKVVFSANATGRTYDFYVGKDAGTVYDTSPPRARFYGAHADQFCSASSILYADAGATFRIYYQSTDYADVSIQRIDTIFWIRKLGGVPTLLYPYP